jgi:hypothetical protein
MAMRLGSAFRRYTFTSICASRRSGEAYLQKMEPNCPERRRSSDAQQNEFVAGANVATQLSACELFSPTERR